MGPYLELSTNTKTSNIENYKEICVEPEAAQELIDRLQTPENRSAAGPDKNTAPRAKNPADQGTGKQRGLNNQSWRPSRPETYSWV